MTRVSTAGNYQSALLDLMTAQARGADAQKRVSTQKNATDLVGFGRQTEVLTALRGSQSRLEGFIGASEAVAARLTTQDLAMNQVNDGIGGLREAIGNALSAESGTTLMLEMENNFQSIRGGLNMRHQGVYLFAGAASSTQPVMAANLTDLAAAPTTADLFFNDDLRTVSRVAEGTTLQTGFLAEELGTDVVNILRDIQAYHTGGTGPLSGRLNATQRDFLKTQLQRLEDAAGGVVEQIAKSGSMANQVDSLIDTQQAQSDSLEKLVSDRVDADMAKAITDLQLSQVVIQASAQVVAGLRDVSLLNFLR